MTRRRVLVVGGGYAGCLVAQRIARATRQRSDELGPVEVMLVNASPVFVERIRLHEVAAGGVASRRAIADLVGPDVRVTIARAVGIDASAERLAIDTDEGSSWLGFDVLVLATGSKLDRTIDGSEHALGVDSVGDAMAIGVAARASTHGVSVIGGGLTAIEIASELRERLGVPIQLVASGPLGGAGLSAASRAYIARWLATHGIEHLGRRVIACRADGLTLDDGSELAGLPVLASGMRAHALARESGLPVGAQGQLLVDPTLASRSHAWLFGAGDAMTVDEPVGAPLHMACKTAMATGYVVSDNVVRFLAGTPRRTLRFGDTGVCLSLGRRSGVIQLRDPDGTPTRAIRGRVGSWVKEAVCRETMRAFAQPWRQRALGYYEVRGAMVRESAARPWLTEGA